MLLRAASASRVRSGDPDHVHPRLPHGTPRPRSNTQRLIVGRSLVPSRKLGACAMPRTSSALRLRRSCAGNDNSGEYGLAVPSVDWSQFIRINWDERQRESSVVRVAGAKIPADPPIVSSRCVRWEVSSAYPRIFGAPYRFDLDTIAINRGLKEQRGRTLVARHVQESSSQMPLAVICWHLPQRITDPLLVIAASPRQNSQRSPTLLLDIETGFTLLVDALLYVAAEHRAWALARLPAGTVEHRRAQRTLGSLLFDVEGNAELVTYLEDRYDTRLSIAATKSRAPKLLRLAR